MTKIISYATFPVIDRGYCVWSKDIQARNLEFLRGLDPSFFVHAANAHDVSRRETTTDDREMHQQATALRLLRGVATEALFAFLGATVQAPACVFGWLAKYKQQEIGEFVRRVQGRKALRVSADAFQSLSWETISRVVRAHLPPEHSIMIDLFAIAWSRMAADYLNDNTRGIYNSIKHGLRVSSGSFSVSASGDPGLDPLTFVSPTSHSHFALQRIVEGKPHYSVARHTVSADPGYDQAAMAIAAASLANIITFLRVEAGDAELRPQYAMPDRQIFDQLAQPGSAVKNINISEGIIPREEDMWSEEDILCIFDESSPI
jgi:hypothetical protein